MKTEILKLETPELSILEKSKAEKIKSTFEPMSKMLQEFESEYNNIIIEAEKEININVIDKAKRLRIDIGKVRIETGKLKDKQKEYIKLEDKAIMGVHNILVWAVKEKEDKLKEIEKHFEVLEQQRLEKLQNSRVEQLSKYVEDAIERDLATMEEDVWSAYFNTKKQDFEDKIRAEKEAEQERIKKEAQEKAEQERIRKENEKLRKEAERKAIEEQKQKAEREANERKELEIRAREKEEQDARERKIQETHEKELQKQKAEREAIEKELQAKKDLEIKAKKEQEEAIQQELNKGDRAKLNDLINDLENLKTKYSFKSKKNIKLLSDVNILIDKIIIYINK